MSLNRMAMRVATVLALTNYYQAPWPTMAKGRVFDSRIDPLDGTKADDLVPSIIIYTDDDEGDGLSNNNGGPPFERSVTLNMWLTLGQKGTDTPEGDPTVVFPETDPQLEAMLDLFEYQVRFALANYGNPWTRLWLGFILRVTRWNSERLATEAKVRLAARQITATIVLKDDDLPGYTVGDVDEDALPENIAAMLAAVTAAGGAPRGDVAGMVALLQEGTVPVEIELSKLRRIWMGGILPPHTDETPATPTPQAITEDLYPDEED